MSAVEILGWIAAWIALSYLACKAIAAALSRTRPHR